MKISAQEKWNRNLGHLKEASKCAEAFRVNTRPPIYIIGTFDRRVTVLNQQQRALNLAWSLVESGVIPSGDGNGHKSVAIVGGGFAGLTFAAALVQKNAHCNITIFEERDTLLPLQQGSDTRWLHPRIYDWPDEGSEASAAMLPVLNWTAARASDVVVQVLGSWKRILDTNKLEVELWCNARHLQLSADDNNPEKAKIEWVGEKRNKADGTAEGGTQAKGSSSAFDIVILAVGFGLEVNNSSSYWRNETLGQPSLGHHRRTLLLSGQGDGAMIDLLRLRISQFRQDRFLDELFEGRSALFEELKRIRREFKDDEDNYRLFSEFESLRNKNDTLEKQFDGAQNFLTSRLRRDTEVILQLRVRNLAELLEAKTSRTSFQNAFLVYLLYTCGGFTPTTEDETTICARYSIPSDQVIRRHGTLRGEQLRRLMSEEFAAAVIGKDPSKSPEIGPQPSEPKWDGGYFGYPGRSEDAKKLDDNKRVSWRQEYLPGPTELVASAIVGAIAGHLASIRPNATHFRATLHRTLPLGEDELLQQACDYSGRDLPVEIGKSGRTFPAKNATIGLAYETRNIIRSQPGIKPETLATAMGKLDLTHASMKMNESVHFVLAIPILEPEDKYVGPNPTAGVVYIDSKDSDFWMNDSEVGGLVTVISGAIQALDASSRRTFNRIRNTNLREIYRKRSKPKTIPENISDALQMVSSCEPPRTRDPFTFNFDHSDLTPIVTSKDASG